MSDRAPSASIERQVASHYTHGSLEHAIRSALAAMGRDPGALSPQDLAAVDEFHIGGHEATSELADQMQLASGMRLLDVGCGLGGPARFFARRYGCRVAGIDVTPEYVVVARALTRLVGQERDVSFGIASGTALPFADATFERATLLHVGMNIADKPALCAEVSRILRKGGIFAVYDVMAVGPGALDLPVPWASRPDVSFLADPAMYRRHLGDAGFEVIAERNRGEFALAFFRRMKVRMETAGPPPLGLHTLMGAEAPHKIRNMIANLEAGRIAPVEMIARRRA